MKKCHKELKFGTYKIGPYKTECTYQVSLKMFRGANKQKQKSVIRVCPTQLSLEHHNRFKQFRHVNLKFKIIIFNKIILKTIKMNDMFDIYYKNSLFSNQIFVMK